MSEKTKVVFKRSKYYFCKTETAYEMRISDWSSDVCSSDLSGPQSGQHQLPRIALARADHSEDRHTDGAGAGHPVPRRQSRSTVPLDDSSELRPGANTLPACDRCAAPDRHVDGGVQTSLGHGGPGRREQDGTALVEGASVYISENT